MNIIKKVLINQLQNAFQVGLKLKLSLILWVEPIRPKTHTKCSVVLGTYARKGDVLVSRVEHEFWSSLEDYIGSLCPTFSEGEGKTLQC